MIIERDLDRLSDTYDVVVVGGGITGVCVAREAAGRGPAHAPGRQGRLRSRHEFGHLEVHPRRHPLSRDYEFGVVRESLRERRVLSLPHRTWSQPSLPDAGLALVQAGRGAHRPPGYALYDAARFRPNRHMPREHAHPDAAMDPSRRACCETCRGCTPTSCRARSPITTRSTSIPSACCWRCLSRRPQPAPCCSPTWRPIGSCSDPGGHGRAEEHGLASSTAHRRRHEIQGAPW